MAYDVSSHTTYYRHMYAGEDVAAQRPYRSPTFGLLASRARRDVTRRGRDMLIPIEWDTNRSYRAHPSTGLTARAGQAEGAEASVPIAWSSAAAEFNLEGLDLAAGGGAFFDFLTKVAQDTEKGWEIAESQLMWGDGTGIVAKVQGTGSLPASFTVYPNQGGENWDRYFGADLIGRGSRLAFHAASTGNAVDQDADVVVDYVDRNATNPIVYVDTAASTTTGVTLDDYVILGGKDRHSKNYAKLGLKSAFDDGVDGPALYLGIDRTADLEWQAARFTGVGATNLITHFRNVIERIDRDSGVEPSMIAVPHGVANQYAGQTPSQQATIPMIGFGGEITLAGGRDRLVFAHDLLGSHMAIAGEYEVPAGCAVAFNFNHVFLGWTHPPDWILDGATSGSMWHWHKETMRWIGVYLAGGQMWTNQPNTGSWSSGINTP